ncbi:hypothetical protein MBLNU457_6501t1 [Dothideomycetes sp. NU457]
MKHNDQAPGGAQEPDSNGPSNPPPFSDHEGQIELSTSSERYHDLADYHETNTPPKKSYWAKLNHKATTYHPRLPLLRRIPLPALAIITLLITINLLIWAIVSIPLSQHPSLISTAVLSWSLGLRHALDADHISAIDLMTRRLMATGQRPVTVGTFFSLGHSTIVVITSLVVAGSAAAVSKFGSFGKVGGIIGSSVSASFLILLGGMNVYILYKLLVALRGRCNSPAPAATTTSSTSGHGHEGNGTPDAGEEFKIEGQGFLFKLLKRLFRLIDRPWKMYPLGVLFGLGFDTSSEIALLGIAAISASQGTSIWLILIFPVLFTAGMCLLDTLDGALMMTLYSSARLGKDAIAVLFFQVVLTGVTVVVAVVIGVLQLLNMVLAVAEPEGKFWDGVGVAGDNYDIIGGSICGSFLLFGALGALVYKPWRRRVDAHRELLRKDQEERGLELQRTTSETMVHGVPEVLPVQPGPSNNERVEPITVQSSKGPRHHERLID